MNHEQKKVRTRIVAWSISGLVALMFLSAGVGAIKLLLSDDSRKRQRQVQMVTLVKPPPPPKIKEKPPEPVVQKKEEIIEPQKQEPEPDPLDDLNDHEAPLDDDLGLDADGAAGADGFGLRAKKGGRSILGAYGEGALMRKYAWYTRILQDELRKKVNQYLERNGGAPDGNMYALIFITLDGNGQVTEIEISRSSGNPLMDTAVKESLLLTRVSEPPPSGMPKSIKLKISAKG
jgi:protein TonB